MIIFGSWRVAALQELKRFERSENIIVIEEISGVAACGNGHRLGYGLREMRNVRKSFRQPGCCCQSFGLGFCCIPLDLSLDCAAFVSNPQGVCIAIPMADDFRSAARRTHTCSLRSQISFRFLHGRQAFDGFPRYTMTWLSKGAGCQVYGHGMKCNY